MTIRAIGIIGTEEFEVEGVGRVRPLTTWELLELEARGDTVHLHGEPVFSVPRPGGRAVLCVRVIAS